MTLRFSSLLVLLVLACGRTDHNDAPTLVLPSAGAGGTSSSAGGPSTSGASAAGAPSTSGASAIAGSGGATERNCLFPSPGLEVVPTGDEPARRYGLSQPYVIEAAWDGAEFAAAYDVNGDAVSDLLLLDEAASPPRFRLLLTSPPPDVLELVESDCEALRSLPPGRLILRDLDGDGVEDFVVGAKGGLFAYLNREQGLLEVLSYEPPSPTERAPLINLGVADLNGDEQPDLVASFDRLISEATLDFEIRVVAFLQEGGRFVTGQTLSTPFSSGRAVDDMLYTGYLTAGRFKPDEPGTALVIGHAQTASDFRSLLEARFDGTEPRALRSLFGEHAQQALVVPRADATSLLLAVGQTELGLVEFNDPLPSNPQSWGPQLVATGKLAFMGGSSHELGGGGESPRHFVYDVERDGDLDFLESDPASATLALHVNHDNETFDAPQLLDVMVWGGAESPFIQVGPVAAVIGRTTTAEGRGGAAIYIFVKQDE